MDFKNSSLKIYNSLPTTIKHQKTLIRFSKLKSQEVHFEKYFEKVTFKKNSKNEIKIMALFQCSTD